MIFVQGVWMSVKCHFKQLFYKLEHLVYNNTENAMDEEEYI